MLGLGLGSGLGLGLGLELGLVFSLVACVQPYLLNLLSSSGLIQSGLVSKVKPMILTYGDEGDGVLGRG